MSNSVIPTQCQNKTKANTSNCTVVRTDSLDTCSQSLLTVHKPLKVDCVVLKQLDTAPPSPPLGYAKLWIDLSGDVQVKLPSV